MCAKNFDHFVETVRPDLNAASHSCINRLRQVAERVRPDLNVAANSFSNFLSQIDWHRVGAGVLVMKKFYEFPARAIRSSRETS